MSTDSPTNANLSGKIIDKTKAILESSNTSADTYYI